MQKPLARRTRNRYEKWMLHGIRILDLSRLLPGPACTWYLSGLGASVDRVEPPVVGDPSRHFPPFVAGVGALFAAMSRGKRSLALNLRHPDAADIVRRLLPTYDVLIESFKPGVMETMGLDPKELIAAHPRLIVVRLSGYGQSGPWRDRPGHDINFVGETGLLDAAEPTASGPPVFPVQVADFGGALVASTTIAAALFARERTGEGRVLDLSLAEAALSFAAPQVLAASAENQSPPPGGAPLAGGWSMYRTYRCADGHYITLASVEPRFQAAVIQWAKGADSREALETLFLTETRDTWVARLGSACVGRVTNFLETAGNDAYLLRGSLERVGDYTFVVPPTGPFATGDVPGVGAHSTAILTEAGFTELEIRHFHQDGLTA